MKKSFTFITIGLLTQGINGGILPNPTQQKPQLINIRSEGNTYDNQVQYNDPYCAEWNTSKCVRCSVGFAFQNGICKELDAQCKSYSETRNCIQCYKGYELKNGSCVEAKVVVGYNDPYCAQWKNGNCTKCSSGFIFQNSICAQMDAHCRIYDEKNICSGCYLGYELKNGKCQQENLTISTNDPYCVQWKSGKCSKCSFRYYFDKGICVEVDPHCKVFNNLNGNCTQCYRGFQLRSGKCLDNSKSIPNDPYCAEWKNNVCIRCSFGFFFFNGTCFQADPDCRTFNEVNGKCTNCYGGYNLKDGKCIVLNQQSAYNDINCAKWKDSTNCERCIQGYSVSNGKCGLIPRQSTPTKPVLVMTSSISTPKDSNDKQLGSLRPTPIIQPIQKPVVSPYIVPSVVSPSVVSPSVVSSPGNSSMEKDQFCLRYYNNSCFECYPGYSLNKLFKKCLKGI